MIPLSLLIENKHPHFLNALIRELWLPNLKLAIESELSLILDTALQHMPAFMPPLRVSRHDLGNTVPQLTSMSIRNTYHQQCLEARLREASKRVDGRFSRPHEEKARRKGEGEGEGATEAGALQPGTSLSSHSERKKKTGSDSSSSSHESSGANSAESVLPPPNEAIVVELGVVYEGAPKIEIEIINSMGGSMGAFGLGSVRLTGRVEVVVAPLIPRLPVLSGFQFAFINRPRIEFNLTGLAASANAGPWTDHFRSAVDAVLSSFSVLPNRVVYKIDSSVDFVDMARSSHPFGVLRVAVLRGEGFPHTDRNPIKQSLGQSAEPDVYIRLRLGATEYTTSRVDNREDPVYNAEVFDFILATDSPSQKLHIEAYDYDLGPDDALGTADIDPTSLVGEPEILVDLQNSPMQAEPTLRLAARVLPLSSALYDVQSAVVAQRTDSTRPKFCSNLMLNVAIDRGKNLPCEKKLRPFVRVMLHGKKLLESWPQVCMPTLKQDACWRFSRHVLIEEDVNSASTVRFEVRDAESSNEIIGHAFLHLGDLTERKDCSKVYEFALMGARRADAVLRVCVGLEAIVTEYPLWQMCSVKMQMEGRGPGRSKVIGKTFQTTSPTDHCGVDSLVRTKKMLSN